MTLDEIALEVGRNLKLLNSAHSDWVTNRAVTEDDVKKWINQIYRDDIFTLLAMKYPSYFEQTATTVGYISASTIASVSGTTLTVDDGIFSTGVEGLYAENNTQSEKLLINTYTSSTEVEMESSVDDWDVGDTIYVLGQEFAIGNQAGDAFDIRRIEVKYKSSDDYILVAEKRNKHDLFKTGYETYDQTNPFWYPTQVNLNSMQNQGFGIRPQIDDSTAVIRLTYIEKPATLSDSNTPFIPCSTVLITGATARGMMVMQDSEGVAIWKSQYNEEKAELLHTFNPVRTGEKLRIRESSRTYDMRRRTR